MQKAKCQYLQFTYLSSLLDDISTLPFVKLLNYLQNVSTNGYFEGRRSNVQQLPVLGFPILYAHAYF